MLSHKQLLDAIPNALQSVDVPGMGDKISGKVRDMYRKDGQRILITTDRISAFDRVLGYIPYKGQVLNQLTAWWFEQTQNIIANHMISTPDPNVMIVREAEPLPVEVVVRGFITGVTSTSLWTLYETGERTPYGIPLPDGLSKNDPLPHPIITPTTKAQDGQHDEIITRDEILSRKLVDEDLWQKIEQTALALYTTGKESAEIAGLVLVDTKYEFGLIGEDLVLIDELHTPDSSRYWTLESHKAHTGSPVNMSKEFMREWFAIAGYRGEGQPPRMPGDLIAQVANRYISVYQQLTGQTFTPGEQPAQERIIRAVQAAAS